MQPVPTSKMGDRENLSDFFTKVLDGIGYGMLLTRTNRASTWMKNNNGVEGQCINFLKDNISEENLVTIKEMSMFTELQKQNDLPDEAEIDKELAEYLGDRVTDLEHTHLSALHNEGFHALKYYEALELEEKILRRQCSKLKEEISILEIQRTQIRKRNESILISAAKTNTAYNSVSTEIQLELSKISDAFSAVLHQNADEERNLFRINFDTFRKINNTFRKTVNAAVQKQFDNAKKCGTIDECCNDISLEEDLTNVVQNLGRYNYQSLKWKCEETELEELSEYVENVLNNSEFESIDSARLKSLTDANMEKTYFVQRKITHLTEVLEKFHSDYIVKKMLMAYRKQLKRSMKSDYKFLKRISDLCADFVDWMTLQALLSQKEKENIEEVIATCAYGRQRLEEHARKHLKAVSNLRKLTRENDCPKVVSSISACSSKNVISQLENGDVSVVRNKILSFVDDCLNNYFGMKEQLEELNSTIFSGPVRQIFFCGSLRNDEILIKAQYDKYNDQYKLWKAQFLKISEKSNVTEVDKWQRSFGLMFLTNSAELRNCLEQLRNLARLNRSKSSRTLSSTLSSATNFFPAGLTKGNRSHIV